MEVSPDIAILECFAKPHFYRVASMFHKIMGFLIFSESETFVFQNRTATAAFSGQAITHCAPGDWFAEFWRELILNPLLRLSIYRK